MKRSKSSRWTQEDLERLSQNITIPKPKPTTPQQQASFALGRLKAGKMNKTEAAYDKYLQDLKHTGDVLWHAFEPMNLKLAEKCFYRVDFMVMTKSGQLECHEVKGFWTDDALVKIKTAAEKFPFRFLAVKKLKGSWETREF